MTNESAMDKPAVYYDTSRELAVRELPRPLGRVLDVGCGSGATADAFRAAGAARIVGIEIDAAAAESARARYDEVHAGDALTAVNKLDERFDTITCYDVLEHLVDPWAVLRRLRELGAEGSHIHVSVPNARHLSLLVDVVGRGTFGYTDWGHRDNTHLRWFTPRDLRVALEDAGWDPVSSSHTPISRPRRLLGKLTRGRSTEFLVWQWQILARRQDA